VIYLDGEFLPEKEAKIPVTDRGFLLGDGLYTTVQVRNGEPLFLDIHLQRLMKHCEELHIAPPTISRRAIEQLIEKNEALEGIWRLKIIISGGEETLMRLPKRPYSHLIFLLTPFTPAPYAPLRMGFFPMPVIHPHATFKSLAHLSRYYVMEHAYAQGWDDCVTTTEQGLILEASFGNLLWIEGKRAWTPSPELPLHFGVTITVLKTILEREGFEVHLIKAHRGELPKGSLFRVNTMSGIRPVEKLGEGCFALESAVEGFLREKYEEEAGLYEGLKRPS